MSNVLKLALISLMALFVLAVSFNTARADPADNTFSGSTTAPGGTDKQFEVKKTGTENPGTFHPVTVKVGGVAVEFTIINDNTSSPEIVLNDVPARGATVEVSGTTSGSGGPYTATCTW